MLIEHAQNIEDVLGPIGLLIGVGAVILHHMSNYNEVD